MHKILCGGVLTLLVANVIVWTAVLQQHDPGPVAPPARTQAPYTVDTPYFGSCKLVKQLGEGPFKKGEPGYRAELDADKDGMACE
jgi:hypothetical protein